MRITCPSCGAQYDVDDNDISFAGQDVQCSECLKVWVQRRDGSIEETDGDSAPATAETATEKMAAQVEANPPAEVETAIPDGADSPFYVYDDSGLSFVDEIIAAETGADTEKPDLEDDTRQNGDVDPAMPPVQDPPATHGDVPIQDVGGSPYPWEEIAEAENAASADNTDAESDAESVEGVAAPSSSETPELLPDTPAQIDIPESALKLVEDVDEQALEELIADPGLDEDDKFDEQALLKAFRSQIEVEEKLAASPSQVEEIDEIPEELIGKRARVPDIDAIKESVRWNGSGLSDEAMIMLKPRRYFRRGFILSMVLFTIAAAVYVLNAQIATLVPAAAPALDIYVGLVDIVRTVAAKIGNLVIDWTKQGFDWVMAKVNG